MSAADDRHGATDIEPPRRPALLTINKKSRRGAEAAELVLDAFRQHGIPTLECTCDEAARLPDAIREAAPNIDSVVVGGGDGTLNSALPALLDLDLPLGIIPLGTANDLARTLNIPIDPVAAAGIIAAGRRQRIDVGEVNGHPYFNVASMGFGVDLTEALTRDAKKRWGVLGYAVAGFRTLRRMRSFTAEIEQDGKIEKSRTIHLAVGNGRHYGGGMTVSENATIDDGKLNIYSLEVTSRWKLLALLPAMRKGHHGRWREVRTLSASDITVRTRKPRSVNTDGEITTETPARFRVRPGALEVFCPEAPPASWLDQISVGGALASMAVKVSKIS